MTRDEILLRVQGEIVRLTSHRACDLAPEASLTTTLGLDSIHVESLFAFIERELVALDLTAWFVRNTRAGTDTIQALVDQIHGAHAVAARDEGSRR